MTRTYGQMITLISTILQDTGNVTFTTAELDLQIALALAEISRFRPYDVRYTLTPAASSRNITFTSEQKRNLIVSRMDKRVEYYPAGQTEADFDEKQYRNCDYNAGIISLKVNTLPLGTETIYIRLPKKHIFPKPLADTAGAVNALTAAGAASLVVKSLGADAVVPEDTKLEIAGDDTDYTVTEDATITAGIATCKIYPALTAQAAENAVVTLTVHESTLDREGNDLEDLLADLVASRAAINKARYYIGNSINIGNAGSPQQMLSWGEAKLAETLASLRRLVTLPKSILYSRD